jgi:hypothetical protein
MMRAGRSLGGNTVVYKPRPRWPGSPAASSSTPSSRPACRPAP